MVKLVVDNDPKEVAERLAAERLEHPLRNLAANILRVVRGAGKSYALGREMSEVLKAYQEYWDAVGTWPPPWVLDEILAVGDRRLREGAAAEHERWASAVDDAVKGSLQVAAARLLGQRAQEASGQAELMRGVEELEDIRGASRSAPRKKPKRLGVKNDPGDGPVRL